MKVNTALVGAFVLALGWAGPAVAGPIGITDLQDQDLGDVLLDQEFVAESRWGDAAANATWEVGLGVPHTHDARYLDDANHGWSSGEAETFLLAYDGSTLTYDVDAVTVTRDADLSGNGMLIRLAGGSDHGTAAITIDWLDGSSITPIRASASDGLTYLRWDDVDLSTSWSIGGTQTLTSGERPLSSRPAMQFKGGTLVPEPGSLALVGLGLTGITIGTRRRRRV